MPTLQPGSIVNWIRHLRLPSVMRVSVARSALRWRAVSNGWSSNNWQTPTAQKCGCARVRWRPCNGANCYASRRACRRSSVSSAHTIRFHVGELTLDRIRMETPGLIEQGRGHRAEAMSRHFLLSKAQRAQGGVDRILGHRPLVGAERGEAVAAGPGQLPELLEQAGRLGRKRHAVRAPHLHLLRGEVPDRSIEIEFCPFGLP